MKHPGPSAALTALLLVTTAVLAYRTSPFAANVDDHVRLYFGAYAGVVELGGGAPADALRQELRATTARMPDAYLASRFVAAQTPYSPLTIASVAVAEAVRPLVRPERVLPWILAEQTALWTAMLGLALWVRRRLPACPVVWFLAAGLPLAWIHAHTNPFLPVPRAYACVFTALALALAATRGADRWPAACLALATTCHPLNQVVNLAIALPAAALLAGTAAAPALDRRGALRLGAWAIACTVVSVLLVSAANPRGSLALGTILAEQSAFDPAASWSTARPVVQRLTVGLGLPLVALAWRYCGPLRASLLGALVVTSLVASAVLAPLGDYPLEYLSRAGGAWSAVLFALCLRGDLLPDWPRLTGAARLAVVAAVTVVALPAAFPEITRSPNVVHGRASASLSRVEAHCVRILRSIGEWPPRRRPEAAP